MEVVRTSTLKLGHARTADAHAVSPAPPAGHRGGGSCSAVPWAAPSRDEGVKVPTCIRGAVGKAGDPGQ